MKHEITFPKRGYQFEHLKRQLAVRGLNPDDFPEELAQMKADDDAFWNDAALQRQLEIERLIEEANNAVPCRAPDPGEPGYVKPPYKRPFRRFKQRSRK